MYYGLTGKCTWLFRRCLMDAHVKALQKNLVCQGLLFQRKIDHATVILVVGFFRIFTYEQEETLARYISEMEIKFFGLTGVEVRKLAIQFAEKLSIPHKFNQTKKKAEHTSFARATGFNQEAVQEFFSLLEEIFNKHKHSYTPNRIYNVDETGISIVPKSSPKIIAKRGRKQVGGFTAAERRENVTATICISAAGTFMPPFIIFPRVKENLEFIKDTPAGAWAEFHKTGCMQIDIFTKWFKKFVKFSQATPENPVLLLLDGHVTHVKNLNVIDLAKENGVEILCFPPHCTHKMQPLDVGFNGTLNKSFGAQVAAFQRRDNQITLKNLYSIFGKAYIHSAKMETAINSFRRCRMYPFDSTVFPELNVCALEGQISLDPCNSNKPG
ncbi:tigger transposable element-derived protein 6-like [Copidosoma floridanum]|uniref:tigger transposable element-derived protein 6-like n=1 Tax=Copidosoma floridanum TaxID=29053 RepID=UPI0006C99DBA|nr:tigger transposable element-derived protein 6-like [Copidosoma floridanum]